MTLAFKTPPPEPVAGLYESDYSRWLFENARLLREGRFNEVDIINVAEEPDRCPYTPEQVLGHGYLPEA